MTNIKHDAVDPAAWHHDLRAHLLVKHRNNAARHVSDEESRDQHWLEHHGYGELRNHDEPAFLHDWSTYTPIQPDADGHFIAAPNVWATLAAATATPPEPTADDFLARVLAVLDDLDARAATEDAVSAGEFDFNAGLAYAVERIRDVLPAAEKAGADHD